MNLTASTGDPALEGDNRGPQVLSVTIIFTILSFAFVLLRIISRCFIVGRWKWDDWFIIFSWILALGFSFSICWGVKNGLGRRSESIHVEEELPLRISEYVFSILYNPVLMCTKTSICIFYLSVAKNQHFFRWGVYATLAVVNLAGFALTLVNTFQCHPPSALVKENIPPTAVCIDIVAIYLASAPVNIITDLALLLLPMPMLTAMRMPKKQKIILIVTFGFGLFVSVVDVVRIYYLQEAFQARVSQVSRGNAITSQLLDHDDFPWYAAYSFMWSAVEVHVGIMCASVPALKPLIARILPTMLYDTTSQIEHSTWRRHKKRNLLKSCFCCFGDDQTVSRSKISPTIAAHYGHSRSSSGDNTDEKRSSSGMPLNPPLDTGNLDEQIRPRDFASDSENPDSPLAIEGKRSSILSRPDETPEARHNTPSDRSGSPQFHTSNNEDLAANDDDHPMDFMEFITTPDMHNTLTRQATFGTTETMSPTADPQATFFDFYNVGNHKTMTEISGRESIMPIAAVTILFFLWGFAYGLLEQLNAQFKKVAELNQVQTVALHSAYFGAYFFAAPTLGQLVLRKAGFKMTFICGLCVYATGTLIFWPSAVLVSYPAFLVSNAIVGAGVSIIEVGANPFIALCGPPRYSEARLNLSQAVQAVGTVLSPLLAQKVLFGDVNSPESLIDCQWTYLAISLFDVALAVVIYYIPIPEAEDGDFETTRLHSLPEGRRISEEDRKIPRSTYLTLGVAVFSMFTYLGAQEVISTDYQPYITAIGGTTEHLKAFDWQLLGYTTFAVSRFLVAGLALFVPPYLILGVLYVGIVVTSALALGLSGPAGGAMLVLYEFFQGPIFPLIYSIGLRGLGKHTKWGAVALTTAISGGAVFPIISAAVTAARGPQIAVSVGLAAAAAGLVHPMYLGLSRTARRLVDPKIGPERKKKHRRRENVPRERQDTSGQSHDRDKELEIPNARQVLAALEAG